MCPCTPCTVSLPGQRSAAADLDGVAEALVARGLADDAVVDLLAAGLEHLHHAPGAVHRRAFLVARDQVGDAARMVRMARNESLGRDDHRRQAALHVGRAASVEHAVAHDGLERIGVPFLARSGRDHVRMAGEAEHGPRRTAAGPEVVDRGVGQALVAEPEGRQPGADDVEAAVIFGADRGSAEQVFGQRERG